MPVRWLYMFLKILMCSELFPILYSVFYVFFLYKIHYVVVFDSIINWQGVGGGHFLLKKYTIFTKFSWLSFKHLNLCVSFDAAFDSSILHKCIAYYD